MKLIIGLLLIGAICAAILAIIYVIGAVVNSIAAKKDANRMARIEYEHALRAIANGSASPALEAQIALETVESKRKALS